MTVISSGAAETGATPEIQEILGERYRLVRELGRGGLGVVYLVREKDGDRFLALKLLADHVAADRERRRRFLRAARAAARLSHPNLVSIAAVEQAGDSAFVTMEYVDGETLAERVRAGGPLRAEDATRVLRDAARGVGFAHDRGLIHGNLKPENVIIERKTGRVLVMDLGLALGPGYRGGAAAPYRAPELFTGGEASEKTDVFALGAIGYFAVTGAAPFERETPEEIVAAQVDDVPPRLHVAYTDNSLAQAVERCLWNDPQLRFPNADALARWLTCYAPELWRKHPPEAFVAAVRETFRYPSDSLFITEVTALSLITGLAMRHWALVYLGAAFLAVAVYGRTRAVRQAVWWALYNRYRREDLLSALSQEVEWERDRLVFRYGSGWNVRGRLARRVAYAGLAVAGVGALLSFVTTVPPEVGRGAMVLGAGGAIVAGLVGWFRARDRQVPLELWLRFWKSKVGEWMVRWEGWWAGPQEAPEIAMLKAPSYEEVRLTRVSRDLVNLVPALSHRARSSIRRIREWLHATDALEGHGGVPPLVARARRQLAECVRLLEQLVVRLQGDQPGHDMDRLTADMDAVQKLCEVSDRLLASACRHPVHRQ